MPKSRKRKGAKKYRPRAFAEPSEPLSPAISPAEPHRQFLTFFPLVSGAWIGGGLALRSAEMFIVVFLAAVGLHYVVFERLRFRLGVERVSGIILRETLLLFEMMLFSLAGGYSQLSAIHLPLALFGFVPGCYLAAAAVALYAPVFEAEGWKRTREVATKAGETATRPGGLTQLFTFLLIAGPLVPIILAPFGLLPVTLLICAVPLYFMPPLAGGFFERLNSGFWIATSCIKLAVLAAMLALIGGLLATY